MNQATNTNFELTSHRKIEMRRHASIRSQQRAIPIECVDLIVFFGERSHDGRGGIRCLMTEKSIARLERAVGHSQRLGNMTGCYAVISADDESVVITVGHKYD